MREARATRWRTKSMLKLKSHPMVDEVEGADMDEGRFFVHLKPGLVFTHYDPWNPTGIKSFGGAVEALAALKHVKEAKAQ